MRGVGSRCHVLRNARTLRRKDLLFYLLPLSSPVLHSKKKDSEGGVIGRLLLFHENGGKGEPFRGREKGERTEGSVFSNHNEPSGDQATIVHRDLPRRRSANTSCTPCGCYPSFVRLRISFLPIRLSFETNFSNPSVFPINLRPFNPLCFFNASYFRVDPRSKLSIRYFFSFNLRESRNSVTIRRIDSLNPWFVTDLAFFYSSNFLLFSPLSHPPIERLSPRYTPLACYKCIRVL